LLGLLLKVKNEILKKEGFGGKEYVLQIWNKDCIKVYQKELFRQPVMWSSNSFLVFKPDEEENAGPAPDNDYGSEADSGEGEEAEKAEAINAEPKKDVERINQFYIIKGDGSKSQELIVNNWIQKAEGDNAEEENQIVQALFGKDTLVVVKKFKIYYAHVNF